MIGTAVTFEDYVTVRGPALLRLAYLLCADRHLAEDLTQDVLVRVHGRWRRRSTTRTHTSSAC